MNRTLKEATVKRYHHEGHGQLKCHLANFVTSYKFAQRLMPFKSLTPSEFICKTWTNKHLDPSWIQSNGRE